MLLVRGVGGLYFVNSEATDDVSAVARDPVVAERLWEMSEEVCGLATPTAGTDTAATAAAGRGPRAGRWWRRKRAACSGCEIVCTVWWRGVWVV